MKGDEVDDREGIDYVSPIFVQVELKWVNGIIADDPNRVVSLLENLRELSAGCSRVDVFVDVFTLFTEVDQDLLKT